MTGRSGLTFLLAAIVYVTLFLGLLALELYVFRRRYERPGR